MTSDHPNWAEAISAIADKDYEAAAEMFDLNAKVRKALAVYGDVRLEIDDDGNVSFDDVPLGNEASDYIRMMMSDGFDLAPTIAFLGRLVDNPSSNSRRQALKFVVHNRMPITEEGKFLAYKRVSEDWLDMYTGKIDNHIGQAPEMPRSKVDDHPGRTCSHGLHVASQDYLSGFYGARLIAVEVDPADVVCVPDDYNNSKMRVCKYTVLKELPIAMVEKGHNGAWEQLVVDDEGEDAVPDLKDEGGYSYAYVVYSMKDWTHPVGEARKYELGELAEVKQVANITNNEAWLVRYNDDGIELVTRVA